MYLSAVRRRQDSWNLSWALGRWVGGWKGGARVARFGEQALVDVVF